MDATLLEACNAIINITATGFPLVLPVIPAVTSDGNPSTSNSVGTATSIHKAEKESERRDITNERSAELQTLARKDYNGKMSQANILKYALKAAIKHKREFYSDPCSRGLNAALQRTEQVVIQHLNALNLPHPTNYTTVQRVEKMFEDFRDVALPVFTPKTAPANPEVITVLISLHPNIIDLNDITIPSPTSAPTPIPAIVSLPVQLPASAPTKKLFRPWE